MKSFLVPAFVACVTVVASAQTQVALPSGALSMQSLEQQRDGSVVHLRGNVRIQTRSMELQADEVDFHQDTNEAEARGNVRIKFLDGTQKASSSAKESGTAPLRLRVPFEAPQKMLPPEIVK